MKHFKFLSLSALTLLFVLFQSCDNKDEPVDEPFQLPSKVINKIVIDKDGVKWFATEKGVVSYDGSTWTTFKDEKGPITTPYADLAFDAATGISKLWLASTIGLSAFEFGATSISILNYDTKNSEILDDQITAIGVDGMNVKYVGTPKGLSILKDGKWDEFYGRKGEEILSEYKIKGIGAASNGYIYAATEGGGISRFKYTDAVSGATTIVQPWAWGLPSDTVYTVFIDGIEQWFGTYRGVGYHTSEFTKEDWISYSRIDGLICDSVYAIAKDPAGNVWFGTHKGVSKLGSDEKWTNYTTKDGLISNKVNAIAADVDGSVWFGTDEGISSFANGKWTKF
jgi:ligand-binding sensor domain-containing protein